MTKERQKFDQISNKISNLDAGGKGYMLSHVAGGLSAIVNDEDYSDEFRQQIVNLFERAFNSASN